jgi:stage V sporulation protein D (sporulation-specific penicillin-binding protein)
MNTGSLKKRIRILSACVFLFACILVVRLFYVQIIHGESYSERADRQYVTPSGNILNRGTIFFTKKDGSLVTASAMMSGFKLAISPKDILDAESLYEKLSPYLKISKDVFIQRATKKNDPYEEVAFNLTKEQADAISGMAIKGVSLHKEKWRFYPGGNLSSHVLGFVSYRGDDLSGQYGLERIYNKTLTRSKNHSYVNFFAEVFSDIKNVSSGESIGDIVTTIEPTVSQAVESEILKVRERWNAEQVGVIVMNPMNGEIYAMSALPDFNLNEFGKVEDLSVFRNPLIENVFELGSVIKPLVIAAGIDQGVITADTKYFDSGSVVVENRTISNFDKKGRGEVTMQTVLDQSLNTGMVLAGNKMGKESFRNYIRQYGLGEKTGIDLPNEATGLIRNLENNRDIEYANMSFGQGLATTPIAAIRSFASLANGGDLVSPHLVKQIRYESGLSKTIEYPHYRTGVIKKETSDEITRMLVHVFDSYDKGKHKMPRYSIATKTGTAQVAKAAGGGYYEDKNLHSFFGYFPAYNPRFVVFLYIQNPRGALYASQTLIPPFVNIAKFLLNYYDVPPDR